MYTYSYQVNPVIATDSHGTMLTADQVKNGSTAQLEYYLNELGEQGFGLLVPEKGIFRGDPLIFERMDEED